MSRSTMPVPSGPSLVHVLVVEDDADLRPALAALLELEGFSVETASHGQEALDRLRSAQKLPEVLLLDWLMPVMDGRELLTELAKVPRLSGLPVVVLSGARTIELPAGVQPSAVRILAKPAPTNQLVALLREASTATERR